VEEVEALAVATNLALVLLVTASAQNADTNQNIKWVNGVWISPAPNVVHQ